VKFGPTLKELAQRSKLYVGYDPGADDKVFAQVYATMPGYNGIAHLGDAEVDMETDDELRARIVYVAGEVELTRRLRLNAKLDAIAEEYGLKRRRKDRETTQPIARRWVP
jgi:hypothetical protein